MALDYAPSDGMPHRCCFSGCRVYRHRMYVYLLLASRVNFGLYPGHCECYLGDTLDSIICLQRVSILCFAWSPLVWLKLPSLSVGQLLKSQLSSFLFSCICPQKNGSGLSQTWVEFIHKIWGCVSLSLSFLRFSLRFPVAVVTLTSSSLGWRDRVFYQF